ncbi:MAG: ribosomal L7Ae/L30e/S12e/Gadd45 family protein [Clostridia bacterium]|nr:ribosomal L7Ae/L30e/S12e/Gadd45 family protein [Clostridia bacterium]
MMINDKFYRMLGLAVKSGNAVFGEGAAKDSLKSKSQLVLVSADASDNTKKKFRNGCSFYNVPYIECSDRYSLGKATGKGFAVVVSITDKGFADSLTNILEQSC